MSDKRNAAETEQEAPLTEVGVETLETVCDMALPADAAETGTIHVTAKKNGKQATIVYTFGKDLKDMVELYGEETVFSQALAQMKIKLQAAMRAYLDAERDIAELCTTWKPGVALPKIPKDPSVATVNYFDKLSKEEKAEMIEKLKARLG